MTDKFISKQSFGEIALLASAAVLALTAPILVGLMVPARSSAQVSAAEKASSQPGETNLRFEVASVKPSDPGSAAFRPLNYSPGRYSGENVPLSAIAWSAYDLKEAYQMDTTASWMVTKHYDLAGKVPDGAIIEQVHIMLQHLLAERFGLVVRHETRQLPGFRLVVAKGGAKLRRSVDAPTIDVTGPGIVVRNGTRQFADNARSGILLTVDEEQLHGREETMGGLAHYLVQALHTPVIDATGIEGKYDYDLSFEPIVARPSKGTVYLGLSPGAGTPEAPAGPPSAPTPSDHPSVFPAIKELGLQLESVKSLPIDVLVLDKANPNPTEN